MQPIKVRRLLDQMFRPARYRIYSIINTVKCWIRPRNVLHFPIYNSDEGMIDHGLEHHAILEALEFRRKEGFSLDEESTNPIQQELLQISNWYRNFRETNKNLIDSTEIDMNDNPTLVSAWKSRSKDWKRKSKGIELFSITNKNVDHVFRSDQYAVCITAGIRMEFAKYKASEAILSYMAGRAYELMKKLT